MKKVCLVGCGGIGRLHAKNRSRLAQVFFYSRSWSSAARFQEEFAGGGIFDDFEAVLKEPQIAALVLASPPEYHKEQTIAALQAGKSVLVEKPLCIDAAGLDEIQQAADHHASLRVPECRQVRSPATGLSFCLRGRIREVLIHCTRHPIRTLKSGEQRWLETDEPRGGGDHPMGRPFDGSRVVKWH